MGEKSNKKLIWYILFAVITVVLCYMFIVVYFHHISPYNISMKIAVWPFMSDESVGEIYQDAIVEINFEVDDSYTFEENVPKTVVGVNVHKDGFIVAPYHEFEGCDISTEYRIRTNAGKVYNGKLLFVEEHYNLVIFKCENMLASDKKIKIAYANIEDIAAAREGDEIFALTSPLEDKTVWGGRIKSMGEIDCKQMELDAKVGGEYVIQDCFAVSLNSTRNSFSTGVVFNDSGAVLGFSFDGKNSDGNYVSMPVAGAKLFIGDVIESYDSRYTYSNTLANAFVGFDKTEISCFIMASNENEKDENKQYFYFNNEWHTYTDDMKYYNQQMSVEGFYLYQNFALRGQTILNAKNIVYSIKYNNKTYKISSKLDLYDLCYKLNAGDQIVVYYYEGIDSLTLNQKKFSI